MTLKSLVWDLVDRIKHIRKQTTSPVLTNQPTKWIIDTFFQQSRGDHKTSTCSGSFLCENDVISIPKFSIPDKKLYFKNMILTLPKNHNLFFFYFLINLSEYHCKIKKNPVKMTEGLLEKGRQD